LGNFCDNNGIVIIEISLSRDGYAFTQNNTPYIFINSRLNYAEKVVTGYHELAHLLLHAPNPEVFRRQKNCCWNFSKCDRQAEIVGLVAWMPETQARGLSPGALMHQYDVRWESAEFRAGLNLWVP
jgi:Zn-dependent peptidase ImmA (M78 family)